MESFIDFLFKFYDTIKSKNNINLDATIFIMNFHLIL